MFDSARLLLGRELKDSAQEVGFRIRHAERSVSAGDIVEDAGNGHVAVIAPTGAGKGRNLLIPILLSNPSPAIVLDVKGELAAVTARYRREVLGHEVVVLDPWRKVVAEGGQLNPLDCLPDSADTIADDAYAMSQLLIDQNAPSKEAYWDESSQAIITAALIHARIGGGDAPRNFARVWKLLTGDDPIYALAALVDTSPNMHPYARAQFCSIMSLNSEITRSCILSVIHQHLRLFGSEPVQRATETTSFDLEKIRSGAPLTIYIVAPPSKLVSHAGLFRLWLASLLNIITERRTRPEHSTLFLVDEVAQLGRMTQIRQAVTLMRGYGVRCMLFLQSYAQLKQLYPNEHETIFENCETLISFGHTAMTMSQQMASALGDIAPEALYRMAGTELAMRVPGSPTRVIERLDYLKDPLFKGRFDPHPMFAQARAT